MEDAYGILSISERYVHTIECKIKETKEYYGCRMGDSRQKCTKNNTDVSGSIRGIQHFKGNDNKKSSNENFQTI